MMTAGSKLLRMFRGTFWCGANISYRSLNLNVPARCGNRIIIIIYRCYYTIIYARDPVFVFRSKRVNFTRYVIYFIYNIIEVCTFFFIYTAAGSCTYVV